MGDANRQQQQQHQKQLATSTTLGNTLRHNKQGGAAVASQAVGAASAPGETGTKIKRPVSNGAISLDSGASRWMTLAGKSVSSPVATRASSTSEKRSVVLGVRTRTTSDNKPSSTNIQQTQQSIIDKLSNTSNAPSNVNQLPRRVTAGKFSVVIQDKNGTDSPPTFERENQSVIGGDVKVATSTVKVNQLAEKFDSQRPAIMHTLLECRGGKLMFPSPGSVGNTNPHSRPALLNQTTTKTPTSLKSGKSFTNGTAASYYNKIANFTSNNGALKANNNNKNVGQQQNSIVKIDLASAGIKRSESVKVGLSFASGAGGDTPSASFKSVATFTPTVVASKDYPKSVESNASPINVRPQKCSPASNGVNATTSSTPVLCSSSSASPPQKNLQFLSVAIGPYDGCTSSPAPPRGDGERVSSVDVVQMKSATVEDSQPHPSASVTINATRRDQHEPSPVASFGAPTTSALHNVVLRSSSLVLSPHHSSGLSASQPPPHAANTAGVSPMSMMPRSSVPVAALEYYPRSTGERGRFEIKNMIKSVTPSSGGSGKQYGYRSVVADDVIDFDAGYDDDDDGDSGFFLQETDEGGSDDDASSTCASEASSFAGHRNYMLPERAICGETGTVRGMKNRVRAGIATFLEQSNTTKTFHQQETSKVVVYTTTTGIVRQTLQKCLKVKAILSTLLVPFEERDIFKCRAFQRELLERLPDELATAVPQVFVEGHYLGNADIIENLNELGKLRKILRPYKRANANQPCMKCGGYNFVLCQHCNGSKKSLHRNGFTDSRLPLKCTKCDECGLVQCDLCILPPSVIGSGNKGLFPRRDSLPT